MHYLKEAVQGHELADQSRVVQRALDQQLFDTFPLLQTMFVGLKIDLLVRATQDEAPEALFLRSVVSKEIYVVSDRLCHLRELILEFLDGRPFEVVLGDKFLKTEDPFCGRLTLV